MRSSIKLFLAAVILVSSTELIAQNRLVNPGFAGNLEGWDFFSDSEQSVDFDQRDANGNPMSGSVRQKFLLLESVPNQRIASIFQVVKVVPGTSYVFGGKYRNDNGLPPGAARPPGIGLWWLDAEGDVLPVETRFTADGNFSEGVWQSISATGTAPTNAVAGVILLFIPSHTNFQAL
ncbi:MAG TPA: hypothetical protein VMT00_01340, partial [Thermoanaerobaculia bacterium]|nr:hypothetical protein [Thermoanaerobaculia bacterium]